MPDDRLLLSEFVQWRLAMGLRRRAAQYRLTYDALALAKTRFTMAILFMRWLHAHKLALATCTQADVDTFISRTPQHSRSRDCLRYGRRTSTWQETMVNG